MQQKSTTPQSTHRKKLFGEKMFDFLNYAGFALAGNELLGTGITKWAEASKWYTDKFVPFFTKQTSNPSVPKYASSGRLPMILVALISGNFMVPFIKHYEDRKSEIVRRFDRNHYGTRADTDPDIIQAHKEMDEAPKQSWGSLWKGRGITTLSAIAVDFLLGWKEAPTTKLFQNNKTYQRFASYTLVSEELAEKAASLFKTSGARREAVVGWTKRGFELFTLSSLLTIMFYASSKLFAKKRDEKIERGQHHLQATPQKDSDFAQAPEATREGDTPPTNEVSAIHHENRLSSLSPELSAT